MQTINLRQEPQNGHGFIYILSHPQMLNLYKIGATHKNMAECIASLNDSGLPKPYVAERVYEIDARYLREIELEIHRKLNITGQFNQKFFDGDLDQCIGVIEDAIYLITKDSSNELIRAAINRSIEKLRLEEVEKNQLLELQELKKIEAEKIQFRLDAANEIMNEKREQWLKNWIAKNGDGVVDTEKMVNEVMYSKWDRYVMNPISYIFGFAVLAVIAGVTAPIGPIILVIFLIWFFVKRSQEKSSGRYSVTEWAYQNYPVITIATLEKYEREFNA